MTAPALDWAANEADLLDAVAMSFRVRRPLERDPNLWAAFADDRAAHGRSRGGRSIPAQCQGCGRSMRPSRTTLADWPGTVQHNGRGLCSYCRQKERMEQNA